MAIQSDNQANKEDPVFALFSHYLPEGCQSNYIMDISDMSK